MSDHGVIAVEGFHPPTSAQHAETTDSFADSGVKLVSSFSSGLAVWAFFAGGFCRQR